MELAPRTAVMTFYSPTSPFFMAGLDHCRAQIIDAHLRRLHMPTGGFFYPDGRPLYALQAFGPQSPLIDAILQSSKHDPGLSSCFAEEQKPSHSYIGLIAMAILNSRDCKLVLSDIYQWILDNYSYFRSRGPGWRNSIRHNLSLNDCFVKSGRSANGKGHYWTIHPANLEDFQKGDFRRRRAQRKARKAMGLAVPDDEEGAGDTVSVDDRLGEASCQATGVSSSSSDVKCPWSWTYQEGRHGMDLTSCGLELVRFCVATGRRQGSVGATRKSRQRRSFDVESLLAPDDEGPEVTPDVYC